MARKLLEVRGFCASGREVFPGGEERTAHGGTVATVGARQVWRKLGGGLLIAVLAGGFLPAVPAWAQDAHLQIKPEVVRLKAEVYMADGEYNAAGKLLNAYLKSNPGDKEAWVLMARTLYNLKRYDKALVAIERAGTIQGAALTRSKILFARGDLIGARIAAETAVQRYPRFGDAHHFLGFLYLTQKKYEEAVSSFQKALDNGTTKMVQTHFLLGQALYQLKRMDEAEGHFQEARGLGEGTGYGKATEDFLDLIQLHKEQLTHLPKEKKKKPTGGKTWSTYVQMAVEYDSNVLVTPDGERVLGILPNNTVVQKDGDGVRDNLSIGGDVRLLQVPDFEIRAGLDVNFAYDFLVEEAQLFGASGGIYAPWQFTLAKYNSTLTSYFLATVTAFGIMGDANNFPEIPPVNDVLDFGLNDPYSRDFEWGARFDVKESERMLSSVSAGYILSRYNNQAPKQSVAVDTFLEYHGRMSRRDSHNVRGSIAQAVLLDFQRREDLRLIFSLGGAYRNAEERKWSYLAGEFGISAEWQARDRLGFTLGGRYRLENHFDSPSFTERQILLKTTNNLNPANFPIFPLVASWPEHRTDQTASVSLEGKYQLQKSSSGIWWISLLYLWEHNFSTLHGQLISYSGNVLARNDLSYDKHVVSLGFRVDLGGS